MPGVSIANRATCHQEMGADVPYRRLKHGGYVVFNLSVDIAGPFHNGWDYGTKTEARYALIATVPVPLSDLKPEASDDPLQPGPQVRSAEGQPSDDARIDQALESEDALRDFLCGDGPHALQDGSHAPQDQPLPEVPLLPEDPLQPVGELPEEAAPILETGEDEKQELSEGEKKVVGKMNEKWKREKEEKEEVEKSLKIQNVRRWWRLWPPGAWSTYFLLFKLFMLDFALWASQCWGCTLTVPRSSSLALFELGLLRWECAKRSPVVMIVRATDVAKLNLGSGNAACVCYWNLRERPSLNGQVWHDMPWRSAQELNSKILVWWCLRWFPTTPVLWWKPRCCPKGSLKECQVPSSLGCWEAQARWCHMVGWFNLWRTRRFNMPELFWWRIPLPTRRCRSSSWKLVLKFVIVSLANSRCFLVFLNHSWCLQDPMVMMKLHKKLLNLWHWWMALWCRLTTSRTTTLRAQWFLSQLMMVMMKMIVKMNRTMSLWMMHYTGRSPRPLSYSGGRSRAWLWGGGFFSFSTSTTSSWTRSMFWTSLTRSSTRKRTTS